jgi:hypothetical protein
MRQKIKKQEFISRFPEYSIQSVHVIFPRITVAVICPRCNMAAHNRRIKDDCRQNTEWHKSQ